jgi:hypothetical protein
MRIELFQDLYERYSRLALSFPSDRPIAIKGLEARLLATFGTSGGFGVFSIYLHRCLLWQRAGDALKRIGPSRGGSPVPSWSWMAYDGPIRYMAVLFGQVSWSNDITSTFAQTGKADVLSDGHREGEGLTELKAPVWEIANVQDVQMNLDDPSRHFAHPLQCVVVGKSKTESSRQEYYVMLVHTEGEVYERVGVAIMDRRHIALDGPYRKARIG